MDKFVTISKPSLAGPATNNDKRKKHDTLKFKPYDAKNSEKTRTEKYLAPIMKDSGKPSTSTLTKYLLNTLSDESNPITHSDIGKRSDVVTSFADGHQRGGGRHRKEYYEHRSNKLGEQRNEQQDTEAKVLHGVRLYINGYLSDTTDIEMKRIVTMAGGQISFTAARATHIITSHHLSGSKTHKILTRKSKVQVVKPEWVTDSITAGKRRPEREYAVIKNETTRDLKSFVEETTSS